MLGKEAAVKALENLFRRRPVVDLETLCRALKTPSRMSVFRRLRQFDYLSSYTHAGRYYTLAEIPHFDDDGLWLYRGIGFSRAGTLKNTVAHLVEIGEAGRTHRELYELVRVRVHNALLSLVREDRIDRQRLETMYLYVSVEAERASRQVAARRELLASRKEVTLPLAPSVVIEVLVEVIQTARPRVAPAEVAKRLADRGLPVTAEQVGQIFDRYELGSEKKNGAVSLCALEALREHVRSLENHWHDRVLEISGVMVAACEDPGPCPLCGGTMGVQKTFVHAGKTLKHGTIQIRETIHVCEARCSHPSGALVTRRALSVTTHLIPGRTTGYDVMVFAGLQRFLHHRQRDEIREDLRVKHGLHLSSGEVSDLTRLFLRYLETLHEGHAGTIRDVLAKDGGYFLQVDATGENGRGTLLVALAGWRRWVLDAWKIPTERTRVIYLALLSVVERFGVPCAVLRDLGKAMIPAVNTLVEGVGGDIQVLSCHQHFLADVGEDLLDPGHGELRGLFRHYKIRPNLGALARDLGRRLGVDIHEARREVAAWQQALDEGHMVSGGRTGYATVRALAQWVLDYPSDGNDDGFPFDRPYLALYDRCVTARRAVDAFLRTPPNDKAVRRTLDRLARVLEPAIAESSFKLVAERLMKRARLFDELRDALRLAPKAGGGGNSPPSHPLPVEGAIEELNDIEAAVEAFTASLHDRRPERGPAQDMREAIDIILDHMDTHGETLWGHIVSVSTPDGGVIRIVDRTNYNLEKGLFGEMEHGERRRSGRKNLTQNLEHMQAAAALARNLTRPDYVELVCGSLDKLPEAFAALDAERREKKLAGHPLPPLGRSSNPIPEVATASLPTADRPLLRTAEMRRRVLAAAQSRAPRTPVRRSGRAVATVY